MKDIFGLRAGAPEVVSCLFLRGTLDAQLRWLMAIMRVWHHVLQTLPEKGEVDEVIEQAKGRLGLGAIHAFRWGVTVSFEGFQVGDRWVPAREQWFIARKVLLTHVKPEQARRLAERRPHIFGGLSGWNFREHNRLLMSVSAYERGVLMKMWAGASMCQHKRHQIYGESAKCACGFEDQNVWHLLWQCPCSPPPPIHLEYRKHLPKAQSVAHLLPEKAGQTDVRLWRERESCKRAVAILARTPDLAARVSEQADTARVGCRR